MNKNDERLIDETLDEAQIVADDHKEQDLPEAPTSMTMRVWIKGYGVMLTVRDEKMNSLLKKTETMVDYAISHGWKHTWETTPQAPVAQPRDISAKFQPTCSIHGNTTKFLEGVSKKTGKPYSFWTCTAKTADGSYCKAELTKPEGV